MATLTRVREQDDSSFVLAGSVPAPFTLQERHDQARSTVRPASQDVMPSVAYVQQTVLMTLKDLLTTPDYWRASVPDRRHSMPPSPAAASSSRAAAQDTAPSDLKNLVTVLRALQPDTEMAQVAPADDERALLHELRRRVDTRAPFLDSDDAELAQTLVSLLTLLHRLAIIGLAPASATPTPPPGLEPVSVPPTDIYDALTRQLSGFRAEADSEAQRPLAPVAAVERALLWSQLDADLETVFRLCRARLPDHHELPPLYADTELPPQYVADADPKSASVERADAKASPTTQASPLISNEKMRMDLDAVTRAIDRLYAVAPQLHDQRAELRPRTRRSTKGKQRAPAPPPADAELERMVDLLGRASDRRLASQTVVLDADVRERASRRVRARHEEFVGRLLEHSGAGRMTAQDAVFTAGERARDPEALLTLPEFIRESVPRSAPPENDRGREPEEPASAVQTLLRRKSLRSLRSRSLSAPAIGWFLQRERQRGTPSPASSSSSSNHGAGIELGLSYVAEHHETLRHVLAFLTLPPGAPPEAHTALSPDARTASLVLRLAGAQRSFPLPAPVRPGPAPLRMQGTHAELKLPTLEPGAIMLDESRPLLDATQLSAARPHAFVCRACSLPLLRAGPAARFADLPSEHWAELVDAWMCHAEQGLHAGVQERARQGFVPAHNEVLVGGSYLLVCETAVARANLWEGQGESGLKPGDDWRSVRCKCGTLVGRARAQPGANGCSTTVYRLAKYAIRPVGGSVEMPRVPLSAFVVEDMNELAMAHATYRFVVLDEEEERPRLLLWLFKPNLKLSYFAPKHYTIPQEGTVHVAKVLYKILGPKTVGADLNALVNKYPGFPQAEHLMYPKDVCTRIAVLLKESNACYPETLRTMTGLDVGWLLRA
ncbi:HECT-like ubiquitin-conjugating enzyme-binding-domain-containing protein [Vararia minispora EC-137]|uniref:HECT-like ubiquitin-conjugating enzyme-binding-domain-containing protein n=1 Tax=Vararia minispora EC-137 TaxID=1314806 RepID=A0ACB8QW70_9AGAM|nr:HECT-like ubiquitin-conjugating enzyme-binding-domain-containing protein [Vararia minispora EC-137]